MVMKAKYANDSATAWPIYDLRFMEKLISGDSWQHIQNKQHLWKSEANTAQWVLSNQVQEGIMDVSYLLYSLLQMLTDTSKCALSLDHNEGCEIEGWCINISSFAHSVVYLWQSSTDGLTGAAATRHPGVGAVVELCKSGFSCGSGCSGVV